MHFSFRALLLGSLLVLFGCNSSHSRPRAETDVQAAYCAYIARCEPERFNHSYEGSLEICQQIGACTGPAILPPGVEECADQLAEAPCRPLGGLWGAGTFCDTLWASPAQEGESCTGRGCDEGLLCDSISGSLNDCFVCRQLRSPGEPCGKPGVFGDDSLCIDGYCDETGHCRALREDGDSCSSPSECRGSMCVEARCVTHRWPSVGDACAGPEDCRELHCENGTCRAPGKLGEACGEGKNHCRSDLLCVDDICSLHACEPSAEGQRCKFGCDDGLYCSTDDFQCRRRVGAGGACDATRSGGASGGLLGGLGVPGGSWSECLDGLYCPQATARCTKRVSQGASCEPTELSCAEGLFCDQRKAKPSCEPLHPDGEACATGLECESHQCYGGLCGLMACTTI